MSNIPASGLNGEPDGWAVMAQLWRLMHSVTDDSAPALEGVGLSPKAFFLLSSVQERPFPAELARLMHLPPPTVTYLVKQLEASGLLERRPEPCDLRKFRLVITAAGENALRRGKDAIGTVLAARLKRLGKEEMAALDRIIAILAEGSEKRPG